MKLSHLLLALPLVLGGFVLGDADADDEDDVLQFQRDLPLIEALIDEGLVLAGADDPLNRAQACNRLADQFAREIHTAAVKKSNTRATNLGHCLEELLLRGVANNLSLAKKNMPKDSPRRAELDRLGEEAAKAAKSFEAKMSRLTESKSFNRTLEAIKKARAEVQQAVKGKSSFFDKFRKGKKTGKSRV